MQIGAIIASWSVGVLILEFDWRWIFVAFSMPGILWALGFVSWFRERPELTPAVNLQELELIRAGRDTRDVNANDVNPPVADDDWAGLLKIARRPSMLWLCGQQICRASGYMFFASWFPTFLQKTRDVSVAESGYRQGLVFAGTLTGCIFGGILTDWIWRRTGGLRLSRSGVGAAALEPAQFSSSRLGSCRMPSWQ